MYTPNFIEVNSNQISEFETAKKIIEVCKFPVIVKPADRWSSKGVTKVTEEKDLLKAIDYAIGESFNGQAIIEDFMCGEEYSAEGLCYNGQVELVAFTKKSTTGEPHYIENGHVQPSGLTDSNIKKVSKDVKKAASLLGIQNGAMNAEFIIMDDGTVGIVEVAARMNGDCIGTHLTPLSTGVDYVGSVVDVAMGKKPNIDIEKKQRMVGITYIINKDDLNRLDKLRCQKNIQIIEENVELNHFDIQVVDSSTRHGYYIYLKE